MKTEILLLIGLGLFLSIPKAFASLSPTNEAPSLTQQVPIVAPEALYGNPPPTKMYRDVPAGQSVEPMPWNIVPPLPPAVAGKIVGQTFANDLSNVLEIGYSGPAPLDVKLRTIPYVIGTYLPPVTTHHYAIVGDVRYENVAAGTYLEMWSHFTSSLPGAPDEEYFSRTLSDHGPMEKLEGTHDWREFWLPFDSTGSKSKLTQLDFNLHFAGYGDVYVSNLRLVQYPDPSPMSEATISAKPSPDTPSPLTAKTESLGLDWKSFLLGITATILAIASAGSFSFLSRRLKKRRHERELRRIASLDT